MQGISCTVLPGWQRGCLGRPETDTCDLRSLHTDPVSPSDWTETQSCRTQTLGKCRSVQILSLAPSHLTVWTPQAIHKGYAGQAGSCSQLWPQAMHQIPPVAQMAESAQGVLYVKVMPGRDLWSRRGAMQKGSIPLHTTAPVPGIMAAPTWLQLYFALSQQWLNTLCSLQGELFFQV